MKHLAIILAFLPVLAWGDMRISHQDGVTVGGKDFAPRLLIPYLDLRASDCKDMTLQNALVLKANIQITAFDGLTFKNFRIMGGKAELGAGSIPLADMERQESWWSTGNQVNNVGDDVKDPLNPNPQKWSRVWIAGEKQTITIPRSRVFGEPDSYFSNEWIIRDSLKNEIPAVLESWSEEKGLVTFILRAESPVAPGLGFFSTLNPKKMSRNLVLDGVDCEGMDYFAVFYTKDITVEDSTFKGATKDYNLGFEWCRNITIRNVVSLDNAKFATIGFLFSAENVLIENTVSDNTRIASHNNPVTNVRSNVKIFYNDPETGWYRDIKVNGKDATPLKKAG